MKSGITLVLLFWTPAILDVNSPIKIYHLDHMKTLLLSLLCMLSFGALTAQAAQVSVQEQAGEFTLTVDGKAFMINGMNWDYFPVGTTYSYSIWAQPDSTIREALDQEMAWLKNMGVNTVRMYTGVPAKWITYICEQHGIYTMLNHSFGRYGLMIDSNWVANTEYSDPRADAYLMGEAIQLANEYKNTPGLLMYLLGNENNYGLSWGGAETEDVPLEDQKTLVRARAMYKLMNKAAKVMKTIDTSHPVAMCNGDLLYLDIVVEECPDVDIYGTNMYRGVSFGDAFNRIKKEYGKPFMFTEFGADAFNAVTDSEDQENQAYYMVNNWKEIYANAAGMGKAGNSIGGFTFQFSDGWWKYGQEYELDVHNNNASWASGGYAHDYVKGKNNMNEEWFGIMAKGPTNEKGLYDLSPRAAYYALQQAHQYSPYAKGTNQQRLSGHFGQIKIAEAALKAQRNKEKQQE